MDGDGMLPGWAVRELGRSQVRGWSGAHMPGAHSGCKPSQEKL